MSTTAPASASVTSRLLYLHGFRSGPASFKAQRLKAWLAQHRPEVQWCCPQLPPSPREAMALVQEGTRHWGPDSAVVGSSLGGFYATCVAESPHGRAWRAVLINPAVQPARDLAAWVGEHGAFHDPSQRFVFTSQHVQELQQLQSELPGALSDRARYLPIIATGDELLSWQEMSARYPGQPTRLINGSDHALSDFDQHLPALLRHLGLLR